MKPKRKNRKRLISRDTEQWLVYNIGVPVAWQAMRWLSKTWKVHYINRENGKIKPSIIAIYHGDLGVAAQELPYVRPGVDVLASRSRDGWAVARYVHLFKCRTIRGGSSQGAETALLQMRKSLMRGRTVVIPIDGPRGPEGRVKIGVISVASRTGAPIIPGAARTDRAWRAKSWDRMMVCKPWARVDFHYGDPFYVKPHATREELEAARLELENIMREMHQTGTVHGEKAQTA